MQLKSLFYDSMSSTCICLTCLHVYIIVFKGLAKFRIIKPLIYSNAYIWQFLSMWPDLRTRLSDLLITTTLHSIEVLEGFCSIAFPIVLAKALSLMSEIPKIEIYIYMTFILIHTLIKNIYLALFCVRHIHKWVNVCKSLISKNGSSSWGGRQNLESRSAPFWWDHFARHSSVNVGVTSI